jgi:hypothetical protein
MEERQVTVDAITHPVPRPFLVMATQNPIDMDGTYRLPEAQLDRFLMRISVGYPDHDSEVRVVLDEGAGVSPEHLTPVVSLASLRDVIAAIRKYHVDEQVASYAVRLVEATRADPDVRLGASPAAASPWSGPPGPSRPSDDRDYVHPRRRQGRGPAGADPPAVADLRGGDPGANHRRGHRPGAAEHPRPHRLLPCGRVTVRLTRRGIGLLASAPVLFTTGALLGQGFLRALAGCPWPWSEPRCC